MGIEWLAHAGAVVNLLLFCGCVGVLILGFWIIRNPVLFWDQFNPYLKPYGRLTVALGRVIGSLWAFGAALGCIVTFGDAVRGYLQHHWLG